MNKEDKTILAPSGPHWQGFRWYEYVLYGFITSGFLVLGVIMTLSGVLAFGFQSLFRPLRSRWHAVSFFALWATIASGWLFWVYRSPIDLENQIVAVTVNPNENFATFASQLDQAGILTSPTFFKVMAKVRGVDRRLWVGRYEFTGQVSLESILKDIETGRVASVGVTVPEGLTIPECAGLVARELKIDSAAFARLCYDTVRCQSKFALPDLEGYLFPETYRFNVGVTPEEVVDRMVYSAMTTINELTLDSPDRTMGMNEIVTLASIIEAEAQYGDEREIISSVYHNRLERNMRLQADPTVAFALGVRRGLLYRDLKIDHPYNTYRYVGLPPGPINSPGRASIEAALRPSKTDYLFFVADGSGRHIFNVDNNSHNRARAAVKEARHKTGDDSTIVGADEENAG